MKVTDSQATARWEQLDDGELTTEIASYRQTIRDIIRVLEGLGVVILPDEEGAEQQHIEEEKEPAIAGVEVRPLLLWSQSPAQTDTAGRTKQYHPMPLI